MREMRETPDEDKSETPYEDTNETPRGMNDDRLRFYEL
jgi:hypothetical protein